MNKKQVLIIVLIAFFVGGIGGLFIERAIVPYLAGFPKLSWLANWKNNSPIVINRREEIQIDQGVNLVELAKQSQSYTVSIYTSSATDTRFLGTGVILTSDGLIFTSKNIVGENKEFNIILNDGKSFKGQLRALDRKTEIAVITIPAQNLSIAQFDDAANLITGQRIIALGKGTTEFTRMFDSGIITQTVSSQASLEQVYSTEALGESFGHSIRINQDFVGGPIINIQGKLLGMVVNATGKIITAEGMNQALTSYLADGKITRPYFGINYLSYSKVLAGLKQLPGAGVQVVSVEVDSPAARAGLRVGDYITAVDGTNIDNTSFERLVNRHQSGAVKFTVFQNNVQKEINFNIEKR